MAQHPPPDTPTNLYALTLYAERTETDTSPHVTRTHFQVRVRSAVAYARSRAEALGKGIDFCKTEYPHEEGWRNHQVEATCITADFVIHAYRALMREGREEEE